MNIAVVGAGWAGLAAASYCMRQGANVTLFDAAQAPGGRARGVHDELLGELDNGQHILIGAYSQTLATMAHDLGEQAVKAHFLRLPLAIRSANGDFHLRARRGFGQTLGNALGLWLARGLSLRDKWHATRLLQRLSSKSNQPVMGQTVSQWLKDEAQTSNNLRWLWWPLCIATLNTAPEQACAVLFANVLRDSLASAEVGATDLLIPRLNLTQLWPASVANRAHTRWGKPIRELTITPEFVELENERFDACVLAIPPANLKRLTQQFSQAQALNDQLDGFSYRSITTCYVALSERIDLPSPMLLFDHEEKPDAPAQWVFNRDAFMQTPGAAQLAFVISDSQSLTLDDEALVDAVMTQLQQALGRKTMPKVMGWRCFHEKRATFAARPGLARPSNQTIWPRVMLAGDWTDTGYPSVIEGAVRSGLTAAQTLLRQMPDLAAQAR